MQLHTPRHLTSSNATSKEANEQARQQEEKNVSLSRLLATWDLTTKCMWAWPQNMAGAREAWLKQKKTKKETAVEYRSLMAEESFQVSVQEPLVDRNSKKNEQNI